MTNEFFVPDQSIQLPIAGHQMSHGVLYVGNLRGSSLLFIMDLRLYGAAT